MALIAWVIVSVASAQLRYATSRGNQLSEIADGFSEADALRAAEGYSVKGFTADAGLPDVAYGNRFPKNGLKALRDWCPDSRRCIYTHYPPGSSWLTGVMVKAFGIDHLPTLRLLPIGVTLAAMIFFAASLIVAVGRVRAAGAMLLFGGVPLFSNMMHGLHYQSYALAFQLLELGGLLRLYALPAGARLPRGGLTALAAIGFVQGWLGFDYAFLTAFAAVPLWLLSPELDRWRLLWTVLLPGGGFAVAHFLHFAQVAAYWGSVQGAFDDLGRSARYRLTGDLPTICSMPLSGVGGILVEYLFVQAPSDRYFGFELMARGALVAALLLVRRGRLGRLSFAAPPRAFLALVAALVVAVLWLVVMRQHAACHRHFLPRHLFYFYFFVVLIALSSLGVAEDQPSTAKKRGTASATSNGWR